MEGSVETYLPRELRVDIESIDDEHARLFWQLAALKEACLERNAVAEDELDALLGSLRVHFGSEARLAQAAGLNFTEHARKHTTMLRGIEKLAEGVRQGEADVFSLIRYIEVWFERHILDEDKSLGFNLQQAGFRRFGEQFAEDGPEQ